MTPDTFLASTVIILLSLVMLLALRYAYLCYARPFREHTRCKGAGRIPYLFGRGWRFCPRCNGIGYRLRIGRRLWNHVRRLQRESAAKDAPTTDTPKEVGRATNNTAERPEPGGVTPATRSPRTDQTERR
ncbi:hypothetical protein HNR40_008501 [Nonomuraea endophytica]|uniref:Uncharacterized protein n=1 Tax=Nonomuraea endophytica TaxID=714136 RepID=A0A7W8ADX1_9ACTN|nr:hypothetical protein [Nonomuraea endophytica]